MDVECGLDLRANNAIQGKKLNAQTMNQEIEKQSVVQELKNLLNINQIKELTRRKKMEEKKGSARQNKMK